MRDPPLVSIGLATFVAMAVVCRCVGPFDRSTAGVICPPPFLLRCALDRRGASGWGGEKRDPPGVNWPSQVVAAAVIGSCVDPVDRSTATCQLSPSDPSENQVAEAGSWVWGGGCCPPLSEIAVPCWTRRCREIFAACRGRRSRLAVGRTRSCSCESGEPTASLVVLKPWQCFDCNDSMTASNPYPLSSGKGAAAAAGCRCDPEPGQHTTQPL
jgi:hypothetical protein